uniref:PHD-type domain-containing protein n=1 Tax=Ciona intestinalis TaxID=7719 RepID=F7ADU2_CIOIN|nr:zinc finger protein isoform X1 [Ciona intestinalis]|eukprot:XP_009857509.1 zinc finger protein isoform X1 [Ciona intestinalis]
MDHGRARKSAGRGRGFGWESENSRKHLRDYSRASKNTANVTTQQQTNKLASAEQRFQETSKHFAKDAAHLLKQYKEESSSEEDDLDDDGILSKLTQSYKGFELSNGDKLENLGLTTQYLTECCQSGAITCLVCISSVKRHEQIWSCEKCFAIFHLPCIKQWVLEGVAQTTLLSAEHFPKRDIPWYCPKCRNEYSRSKCPENYYCFCGAVMDPVPDPWNLPHSCGEQCNHLLSQPPCGHKCLLLCHPGPCPPCPQTVKVGCYCGRKIPITRRCGKAGWSCGEKCNKLLSCKRHRCLRTCHSGECDTCGQISEKSCICGKKSGMKPCAEPLWSCGEVCGKQLACGFHHCEKVCHKDGECGDCPRAGVRTCPCGKKKLQGMACTDDVILCEDTCGKNLSCFGNHKCPRRCHFGECGSCPLMAHKPCRCGKREKEVACQKEYTCETRCQKMRACGKHQCRRKCCIGDCPSCEQVCGKSLQCKKHKCQMYCHTGPCYPCPLTSKVTCRCKSTAITVVCGKEKTTRPPRCRKKCVIPPDCHHHSRLPHTCHFGDCPRCKQICKQQLECGHICPGVCHDKVVVKNEIKAAAPWEQPQREYIIKKLPCPPCLEPMSAICQGGHETSQFPCHELKAYSCGRLCGRKLACGNHTCALQCHVVEDAPDTEKAGTNCAACEEACSKPRPDGCDHECVSPCHTEDCPPCRKRLRMRCHCGMVLLKHLCCDWAGKSDKEKERMQSCGNHCPKLIEKCGHPCKMQCHPGQCTSAEQCQKKVAKRCPCKRRKKDVLCSLVDMKEHLVECDDMCLSIKAAKETERRQLEQKKKEEEERKQQEEVERFERKIHRRSRIRKNDNSADEDEGNRQGILTKIFSSSLTRVTALLVFVISVIVYTYINTQI